MLRSFVGAWKWLRLRVLMRTLQPREGDRTSPAAEARARLVAHELAHDPEAYHLTHLEGNPKHAIGQRSDHLITSDALIRRSAK